MSIQTTQNMDSRQVKTAEKDVRRLRLEAFLPYRLNVLAEIVSQSLARLYSTRYGIGIPEWRIVATLGQYGTMSAKEIGRHSHMHKTKVSRAAAALEDKGLLRREPDVDDKRAAKLHLTREGQTIYDELVPLTLDFAEELEGVLSPQDRAMLERILASLKERSQELAARMDMNGGGKGRSR